MSLDLPFDFYRSAGRARRFESHRFALRAHDAELLAAFAILLSRHSGQSEVTLTLRQAGQEREQGPLSSLDVHLGADSTCREVVTRVREGLGSMRDLVSAEGDASLVLVPSRDGYAAFVYDSSLFKPSSVARFAGHLEVLLNSLAGSPDTRVATLSLLSPAEQRFIEATCDGRAIATSSPLVHDAVAARAAAAPAAVALEFRDQRLSYGELNRRANQLAHYLEGRGVGAGSRVVVCVEPGFEIVIALLGILKAGAAYVPLDPSYPAARIRAILDDTKPRLAITQEHLSARFESCGTALLTLDATRASPEEDPDTHVDPGQTAYVFYTSGTTGAPKGILASHANLRHYVGQAQQRYQIDDRDVLPAIARFSFSISLFELLTPLVAGGTLVMLEREHVMDPARMAKTLKDVTVFHAGPSLLKGLVAYIRQHYLHFAEFSRVRHASSGGDMVPPELLESLKEIFSTAEVFVIYGSSEISCMGCTYPVSRQQRLQRTYVGRPFDNVSVRVLDASGNVVPVGVAGEIHFAGEGVVDGYLNRPELTAEKFVTLGGRRFYRTGDTGRLSEDGWLEILGRNDFQVKLRGMRVELGEVEQQLRRAPGVRDAVAVTKNTSDGEKMLVAYLVPEPGAATSKAAKSARIAAVRRHLLEHLPDYMVPAAYVELERLPVNHNLKIDRRALPEPTEADLRAFTETSLREPRTPTEKCLARVWRQLLGIEHIGLDDNFFELGGHSMLALKLSLEVERVLGVPLEGIEVLREPLVVLAAICDRRLGASSAGLDLGAPVTSPLDRLEVFHFGDGDSLYGVLHGPPSAAVQTAALICSPVGQEQVRTRFVLTKLAKQLARRGIPVLMFDFFGCGDSLGDTAHAGFRRWRADIVQAHAELERRVKATHIVGIGVRLGALPLCQVAPHLELERLVLWDPLPSGREYLADLAQMQRQYLRSIAPLGFWRRKRSRPRKNELLGTIYSDAALRELEGISLPGLLSTQRCPVESLSLDCGWRDVARLEDVIPDAGISSKLAALVGGRP
jgi:amino acid adenylation domain-containing protein